MVLRKDTLVGTDQVFDQIFTEFPTSIFTTLFSSRSVNELLKSFPLDKRDMVSINSAYPYNVKLYSDEATQDPLKVVLEFALAGFNKEDLEVRVVDDELQILANAGEKQKIDEGAIRIDLHHGISMKPLKATFKLGTKIDKDKIKSTFVNGLLTIEVPVIEVKSHVVSIE